MFSGATQENINALRGSFLAKINNMGGLSAQVGLGSPKEDWGGQKKLLGGSGRGLDCPSPQKNVLGSCAPFWSSLEPIKIIPPKPCFPGSAVSFHVANSNNHFSVLRLLDFSDDYSGLPSPLWPLLCLMPLAPPHHPVSNVGGFLESLGRPCPSLSVALIQSHALNPRSLLLYLKWPSPVQSPS